MSKKISKSWEYFFLAVIVLLIYAMNVSVYAGRFLDSVLSGEIYAFGIRMVGLGAFVLFSIGIYMAVKERPEKREECPSDE